MHGMNVRDTRVHNYPPRWNAAPSQDLLVIRRNHQSGETSLDPLRWGLIPHWCKDPSGGRKLNAKCETVRHLRRFGRRIECAAAEFAAALKQNEFRVVRAKIEDATGRCPGVRWPAVLRGRSVDHNLTLAKIIRERDAEIARCALRETEPE
jgi:hypothetical protein